jgi:glycosyltransferase involved in cell wall biosynthesis
LVKISIILPTYNRATILRASLESILNQKYTNWELFVIDDFSQDDTDKVVQTYLSDDRIHYIRNSENLGMSHSRKKGLKFCKGDMVFISEDDLILHRDCLEILVDTFIDLRKKIKTLFHIAPKSINVSRDRWDKSAVKLLGKFLPKTTPPGTQKSSRSQLKLNILTGYPHTKYGEIFTETPILPSGGLYDLDLLRKIGFSEDYIGKPIFHEDNDLHFRARKCGLRFFYQPKAICYHLRYPKGGERSFSLLKQQYFTLRNHYHFIAKFFGLKSLYMAPIFAVTHLLYPLEVLITTTFSSTFMKDIESLI